jgi:hypothetical protein
MAKWIATAATLPPLGAAYLAAQDMTSVTYHCAWL